MSETDLISDSQLITKSSQPTTKRLK